MGERVFDAAKRGAGRHRSVSEDCPFHVPGPSPSKGPGKLWPRTGRSKQSDDDCSSAIQPVCGEVALSKAPRGCRRAMASWRGSATTRRKTQRRLQEGERGRRAGEWHEAVRLCKLIGISPANCSPPIPCRSEAPAGRSNCSGQDGRKPLQGNEVKLRRVRTSRRAAKPLRLNGPIVVTPPFSLSRPLTGSRQPRTGVQRSLLIDVVGAVAVQQSPRRQYRPSRPGLHAESALNQIHSTRIEAEVPISAID